MASTSSTPSAGSTQRSGSGDIGGASFDAAGWGRKAARGSTSPSIGAIDIRVVQPALFVDAILTVLVVEAALEDQLPTFLRALRQAVHRRCLLAGAQAMGAGLSSNRVVLFEARRLAAYGQAPYRFACDVLRTPRHGPPVHMRYGLLDEAQSFSVRAAGS